MGRFTAHDRCGAVMRNLLTREHCRWYALDPSAVDSLTFCEGGMFRYLILGLLRSGTPYHGYALMKEYRERSGVQISTGNFYRELQRLVGEGLVQTAVNPADADPRRAPYEITEAGSVAFDAWLCTPIEVASAQSDDELSCRALFIADVEPAVARKVLDRWKEGVWLRGKLLERTREAALTRASADGRRPFAALTFLQSRRMKYIAADLEFLDEFRAAYEQWVAPAPSVKPSRSRSAPAARRRPQDPSPRRPGRG